MSKDPFYHSRAWIDARATQLAVFPICQNRACGRKATNVDHRVARHRGGASLHPSNLMSLCPTCHSSKTARTDGGFGNRRTDAPLAPPRGCDENGYPLIWKSHAQGAAGRPESLVSSNAEAVCMALMHAPGEVKSRGRKKGR